MSLILQDLSTQSRGCPSILLRLATVSLDVAAAVADTAVVGVAGWTAVDCGTQRASSYHGDKNLEKSRTRHLLPLTAEEEEEFGDHHLDPWIQRCLGLDSDWELEAMETKLKAPPRIPTVRVLSEPSFQSSAAHYPHYHRRRCYLRYRHGRGERTRKFVDVEEGKAGVETVLILIPLV